MNQLRLNRESLFKLAIHLANVLNKWRNKINILIFIYYCVMVKDNPINSRQIEYVYNDIVTLPEV